MSHGAQASSMYQWVIRCPHSNPSIQQRCTADASRHSLALNWDAHSLVMQERVLMSCLNHCSSAGKLAKALHLFLGPREQENSS